jgi:hypothetical protein
MTLPRGPFVQYLTQLLLPLLRDTQDSQPSSVVSVSSNAAFYSYDVGVRLSKEAINDPSTYANSETTRVARGASWLAPATHACPASARRADRSSEMPCRVG